MDFTFVGADAEDNGDDDVDGDDDDDDDEERFNMSLDLFQLGNLLIETLYSMRISLFFTAAIAATTILDLDSLFPPLSWNP